MFIYVFVYPGDVDVIQFLIKNGVKIDAKNNAGDTPFHRAALRNNYMNSYFQFRTIVDFDPFSI